MSENGSDPSEQPSDKHTGEGVSGDSVAPAPMPLSLPRPSLTTKQRHLGERLIEYGIYAVSALSIISIFLIFFFVFREAAPVILSYEPAKEKSVASAVDTYSLPGDSINMTAISGTGTPSGGDVYNPESGAPPAIDGKGAAPADTSSVYNPESGAPPAIDGKGAAPADTSSVYNPESGAPPPIQGKDSGAASAAAENRFKGQTVYANRIEVYNPESGSAPGITFDPPGGLPGDPGSDSSLAVTEARKIIGNDYPILSDTSPAKLSHLFYNVWQPNSEHPRYGIYSILLGTLKTTIIALLIGAPIAILAALYTAYFAPKRLREWIKPVIELLASFPSVVLGFFCMLTVATLVQEVFGTEMRLNAVVGGIGLALAIIPIIYTLTEDALRTVPGSLREAALALGASEWECAYRVMLPAATPGIFAAVLLGLGRAIGETMIALMATGNADMSGLSFFESVRTIAATIGAEMGEVVFGSGHYRVLFVLGVSLFLFSFGINFLTEFYIKERFIRKFRGGDA